MKIEDFSITADELLQQTDERHYRTAAHALKNETIQTKVPAKIWKAKIYFDTLQDLRVHADYNLSLEFTAENAETAVEACKGLLIAK